MLSWPDLLKMHVTLAGIFGTNASASFIIGANLTVRLVETPSHIFPVSVPKPIRMIISSGMFCHHFYCPSQLLNKAETRTDPAEGQPALKLTRILKHRLVIAALRLRSIQSPLRPLLLGRGCKLWFRGPLLPH